MFRPIQFLINDVMLPFMQFSYETILPNYGVSIILLTIVVKIMLLPLTHKQFQSMKKMQVLAPKFKELQKKYKGEPQKMQQETMKLYKEHDVNPFGGCLPMLVQLPFLFAIFYAMTSDNFKALLAADGVFPGLTSFWLPNLSQPDHLYILPIVLAVATYFSQKLTPITIGQGETKDGKKPPNVMALMPVFMGVISIKMPAGVLLYWASSQVISTIQQVMIMKPQKG